MTYTVTSQRSGEVRTFRQRPMAELQEYVELHDLVYLWEGRGRRSNCFFSCAQSLSGTARWDKGVSRAKKTLGSAYLAFSLDRFRKTRGRVNVAAGPPRGMRFSQSLLLIVMEPLLS